MQIDIRHQAEKLWQDEFGDDETFIKRLFDLYCDEEHFFSICENGVLKSMLFILDYELLIEERKYKGAYLYGFCAKSEYRKQGIAKQLFKQTEQRLKRSGFDYIFLIAASDRLIDYYTDLGFYSCFSHKWVEWHKSNKNIKHTSDYRVEISKQINTELYHSFASERQNSVLHTAKDLSLYEKSAYDIYYLYNQDRPLALAVVKSSIKECVVLDIVGEDPECETLLLEHISSVNTCTLLYPLLQTIDSDFETTNPYMIKPLSDKEKHSPKTFYFNLLLDK